MIELGECLPKLFSSMVSALPGIVRLGGLVHAVEHDRGAFLKVDRPSMSFDLASLDLHGAGSGASSRYQVGHAERA